MAQHPNEARSDLDRAVLVKLAAKARIVEALASCDLRVIASELREGLDALARPIGDVLAVVRPQR